VTEPEPVFPREAARPVAIRIAMFAIAVSMALWQLYSNGLALMPSIWQYAVHLGFALVLGFLAYPAFGPSNRRGYLLDIALGLVSIGALGFILYNYEAMVSRFGIFLPSETIAAGVLVVLVLELTRRVLGWPLTIIAGLFILYAYFGYLLPEPFGHAGYRLSRIGSYLMLTSDGVFGTALGVSATLVSLFIIFGAFLKITGCGAWFIDLANFVTGRSSGGPAKMAVVSSALMGTISGSAAGNVATTGAFTIPLMKATGYRAEQAGGIEAAASTGGMILPPLMGAGAFVMAEFLGISYSTVAIAAAIPAVLYMFAVLLQVHMSARLHGLRGLSPEEIVPPRLIVRSAYRALPLVVMIYLIFFEQFSPVYAAFWSIGSVVLVGFLNGTLWRFRGVIDALASAAVAMLPIAAACAAAGVIVGVLMLTGVGFRLSNIMIDLAGGSLPVLLVLTMVSSIILGMGVPATAAYIILAVLAAPALVELGVDPLAAHMFVFYFGVMSNITPPVAVAAFVAAGIAGTSPNRVAVEAFRIGSFAFLVPFMFIYAPELLLIDPDPLRLAVALVTASGGLVLFAAGIQGWMLERISVPERLGLVACAIVLVIPSALTDLVGTLAAALYLVVVVRRHRGRRAALAAREAN